jgi:hypothetical protein
VPLPQPTSWPHNQLAGNVVIWDFNLVEKLLKVWVFVGRRSIFERPSNDEGEKPFTPLDCII